MVSNSSKFGHCHAEQPSGIHKSKSWALLETEPFEFVVQGYRPKKTARACKGKVARLVCNMNNFSPLEEIELDQEQPREEISKNDQAFSDVSGGFKNDRPRTSTSIDITSGTEKDSYASEENSEDEQGEEQTTSAVSDNHSFHVPDGFENDKFVPKKKPGEVKISSDHGRQFWGSIDCIPHEKAISLVLSHVDPLGNINPQDCKVRTSRGTFNKAFIVTLSLDLKYVLRVPRFGIRESWNSDEQTAFLTTMETMEYIERTTSLPMPEVIAFDDTHENEIKHPYSIISFIPGRNVCSVWSDPKIPNLEEMRQNILRSLAQTVSALSKLTFDSQGSLQFEDESSHPTVGPYKQVSCNTYDPDIGVVHQTWMHPRNDSWKAALERKFKREVKRADSTDDDIPKCVKLGQLEIIGMMLECFPSEANHLDENGKERFSIKPPDFDWQNILVDDDGNVTGLIDWDDTRTEHGLKGWASCPRFLRHDWIYPGQPPWRDDIDFSPEDQLRYRRDYANYISEAVDGKGDACFTFKSAVWLAIEQALYRPWDRTAILQKILADVLPGIGHIRFMAKVCTKGLSPDFKPRLQSMFEDYLACSPGGDARLESTFQTYLASAPRGKEVTSSTTPES